MYLIIAPLGIAWQLQYLLLLVDVHGVIMNSVWLHTVHGKQRLSLVLVAGSSMYAVAVHSVICSHLCVKSIGSIPKKMHKTSLEKFIFRLYNVYVVISIAMRR